MKGNYLIIIQLYYVQLFNYIILFSIQIWLVNSANSLVSVEGAKDMIFFLKFRLTLDKKFDFFKNLG